MSRTPREIAELTRRMVEGDEEVVLADLFAEDGVMRFPFTAPGMPAELAGRETIRAFYGALGGQGRRALDIEGVDLIVRETDDPEVIVTEIEHHGRSRATGGPYRFRALGVVRVRDGEIVSYDDYMDPVAMATILGRTSDLVAALSP
ncbi:nuclear transport factor 2 family protein [Pseudonocardia humida]|uniref:Nuclear transport factor 2 family protein n=1 Tax=Pseudonocardia humida TaxID=2800819 RepID=A0ABT1A7S4_9PSEU|nr:nuclear transport factor 2 family protein [Pseudonocardia humida]MCO1658968.1 nuclear transport factor 2 family protein [Pseudonocardia humida]